VSSIQQGALVAAIRYKSSPHLAAPGFPLHSATVSCTFMSGVLGQYIFEGTMGECFLFLGKLFLQFDLVMKVEREMNYVILPYEKFLLLSL
jgi:hypothetical protein